MAQSDLEISGARRLLVEGRLTDKLKRRLRSEVADPAKRRKRDEGNALLLADFDKVVSEEAKTSSKLRQGTGLPLAAGRSCHPFSPPSPRWSNLRRTGGPSASTAAAPRLAAAASAEDASPVARGAAPTRTSATTGATTGAPGGGRGERLIASLDFWPAPSKDSLFSFSMSGVSTCILPGPRGEMTTLGTAGGARPARAAAARRSSCSVCYPPCRLENKVLEF